MTKQIKKLDQRFVLIDGQMHSQLVTASTGKVKEDLIVPITSHNLMRTITDEPFGKLKPSRRDQAKIKSILLAVRAARSNASHHLANTLHHVRSKRSGFERIDRITSLTNAISKFRKMRPEALQGGQKLIDAILARAWQAYALLEVEGLDNAHFCETTLPVNDRKREAVDKSDDGFMDLYYRAEYETAREDFVQVL